MIEISLKNYNEMLRYEKDMDLLRALALWIAKHDKDFSLPSLAKPREYIFDIIKYYSLEFAADIQDHVSISPNTLERFRSVIFSLNQLFGISKEDIILAKQQQRYQNSGFWEMRRVIGQFGDMAKTAKENGISHIVTAAVSGCVIGEYLALQIVDGHPAGIPVDHMIFSRDGKNPVEGLLPESFKLYGKDVLIVDDAVMETYTSQVMIKTLRSIKPDVRISLMAIDINPDVLHSGYLDQFSDLYLFEE